MCPIEIMHLVGIEPSESLFKLFNEYTWTIVLAKHPQYVDRCNLHKLAGEAHSMFAWDWISLSGKDIRRMGQRADIKLLDRNRDFSASRNDKVEGAQDTQRVAQPGRALTPLK